MRNDNQGEMVVYNINDRHITGHFGNQESMIFPMIQSQYPPAMHERGKARSYSKSNLMKYKQHALTTVNSKESGSLFKILQRGMCTDKSMVRDTSYIGKI